MIPVYKEKLSDYEIISLEQACRILGKYEICMVAPEGFTASYLERSSRVIYFKKRYFTSIDTYNELLLNKEFYETFLEYEYMLIYQLDCFVFTDRLEEFCKLSYDYIGAPWLYGQLLNFEEQYKRVEVGNGGFSLRHVENTCKLLQEHYKTNEIYKHNEDLFFASSCQEGFKVAPVNIALQFAFETQVEKCYELNQRELPFGCHAWERYNILFWKQYIEEFGYYLTGNDLKNGMEDIVNIKHYEALEAIQLVTKQNINIEKLRSLLYQLIQQKRCVIFGAGRYATRMLYLLQMMNVTVEVLLDNNKELCDSMIRGVQVTNAQHYLEENNDSMIIVSIKNSDVVTRQLEETGYYHGQGYIYDYEIYRRIITDIVYE